MAQKVGPQEGLGSAQPWLYTMLSKTENVDAAYVEKIRTSWNILPEKLECRNDPNQKKKMRRLLINSQGSEQKEAVALARHFPLGAMQIPAEFKCCVSRQHPANYAIIVLFHVISCCSL